MFCIFYVHNKDKCKEDAQAKQTAREGERGGYLFACDLLSLAGFSTKFTSFWGSAPSLIPKHRHSGFRQINEAVL